MEFFKHNTTIDFMAQRKWAAAVSALLFTFSLVSLIFYGLNWGLDFTGGMQIQLNFPQTVDLNQVRTTLENSGLKEASVISYGTSRDVLVTLPPNTIASAMPKQEMIAKPNATPAGATTNSTDTQPSDGVAPVKVGGKPDIKETMVSRVTQVLPEAKVTAVDYIGPQVGKEMASKGWLAIIIALICTMAYIAFRFETRFAIGSTVALIHDPVLILGVFSFFHIEFNLIALTAVLTVIGYSLNDTIVIFDRVRENFRKLRKATPIEVMNQAINQTLSRTIMTSALTLTVILALFFLGGSLLRGFSLAFIIGIIVGTYSSIYVAGSLAIALGLNRTNLLPPQKEALDDRP